MFDRYQLSLLSILNISITIRNKIILPQKESGPDAFVQVHNTGNELLLLGLLREQKLLFTLKYRLGI